MNEDRSNRPPYLSLTPQQRRRIKNRLNIEDFSRLEEDIPEDLREEYSPSLAAESEIETRRWFGDRAGKNVSLDELTCFLGGGVYDHHVPSTVQDLMSRDGFLTSYTPYQPELNQGSLQGMYEFQSMISELMELPVTNASMYDGATAFAEAVMMATNVSRREKVYYSPLLLPAWIDVLKTYAAPLDWELKKLPVREGRACFPDDLGEEAPAAVCLGYPNRYGCADEVEKWADMRPDNKTVGIAGVNPLAMALLEPPGKLDFDVAVGEGQPLGLPLNGGAPGVGLFSAREKFMRKMPGRLVGETTDRNDRRCYVLTLQTREQHIRRQRATSNICTNHALLTIGVAVSLATLGGEKLRRRAKINHERGRQLCRKFDEAGIEVTGRPVFNEVAVNLESCEIDKLNNELAESGWLGGYKLDDKYIVAATEKRTPEQISSFVKEVAEIESN